jgi:hypothetical protein
VLVEDLGFKQMLSDSCCFMHPTTQCYVLLYVDDICIATKDEQFRMQIVDRLKERFKLRDFEKAEVYVGLEMDWSNDGKSVKIHQTTFIDKMLSVFNMSSCNPVTEPALESVKLKRPEENEMDGSRTSRYRSLVGALLYTLQSRPDAAAAVRKASQFMSGAATAHWLAAKRILRYLANTKSHGVVYTQEESYELTAYCDSDWGSDLDDRKSVSGYVVYAQGGPIVWKSKKQPTVARSSCEAEYVALADTIAELLWVDMAIKEMGIRRSKPIKIYIDNQAAKAMAENPINHERTKHIDISYHFIREVVSSGLVDLRYIHTKQNVADLLTKATSRSIFSQLVGKLVVD